MDNVFKYSTIIIKMLLLAEFPRVTTTAFKWMHIIVKLLDVSQHNANYILLFVALQPEAASVGCVFCIKAEIIFFN